MSCADLIGIMQEARNWLSRPDNDFVWSRWENQADATLEVDRYLAALVRGEMPDLPYFFGPTGSFQEVSLSSGWGDEFIELSTRFDQAWQECLVERSAK